MCNRTLLLVGIWLLAAATATAQQPAPIAPAEELPVLQGPRAGEGIGPPAGQAAPLAVVPFEPTPPGPPIFVMPPPRFNPDAPYRIWVRAELLLWWVKDAPLPMSVIATPDLTNNPGTTISPGDLNYRSFAGFRFTMGGWLDASNALGLEAGVFTLQRQSRDLFAASDNGGNPALAYPFVNQTPGATGNFVQPISAPGAFAGNVVITPSLQLWGAEVNGAINLWRGVGTELTLLGGFRYANLQESLSLSTFSQSLADSSITGFNDNFSTRNQFYGGQIGARFGWQFNRFSFAVTGKLALGATNEVVDIQGNTVQAGPTFGPAVTPGGFFAQASNSGHFTANQFTVMPAVQLKVSYALSSYTRLFLGYDFLYWNQVVRPGSQIDRNINLSQSPVLGAGALSGPASPAPLFNRTDFWAQGVTLGIEFRF